MLLSLSPSVTPFVLHTHTLYNKLFIISLLLDPLFTVLRNPFPRPLTLTFHVAIKKLCL